MKLQAQFPLRRNQINNGTVRRIEFDANTYYAELDILAGNFYRQKRRWIAELELRHRGSNRRLRLAAGDALEKLRISWPAEPGSENVLPAANVFAGRVEALMMDDFAAVITAVEKLRDASPSGAEDFLRADRFDAVRLVRALMPALGLPAGPWCCDRDRQLPPAVAKSEIIMDSAFQQDLAERGALSAFIRNCGGCHRTDMSLPPNYLMGNKMIVRRNIAQCAERIYVRLSMWDVPKGERPKSPMPPVQSLAAYAFSQANWRASRDLATLKRYVAQILKDERGEVPGVGEVLSGGYDAIRSCLDGQFAGVDSEGS